VGQNLSTDVNELERWPIFICYRQADGAATARRLHELLDKHRVNGPDGKVVSPAARRRNLLLCAFRSASSVVQDWPKVGTNCRSSVQIRHAPGGASEGGNSVPQAEQMNAGMSLSVWSTVIALGHER
jgi:hypothetical protein